jgi:hypothetical protein
MILANKYDKRNIFMTTAIINQNPLIWVQIQNFRSETIRRLINEAPKALKER